MQFSVELLKLCAEHTCYRNTFCLKQTVWQLYIRLCLGIINPRLLHESTLHAETRLTTTSLAFQIPTTLFISRVSLDVYHILLEYHKIPPCSVQMRFIHFSGQDDNAADIWGMYNFGLNDFRTLNQDIKFLEQSEIMHLTRDRCSWKWNLWCLCSNVQIYVKVSTLTI